MTTEKQRTFGELVGKDPIVPTARLPLDLVECSDGTLRCEQDVWYDCKGAAHGTEDDAHDADVAIVTELLDGIGKWADEYCTGNTDYADGYAHIVDEMSHDWRDRIDEWIESNCPHFTDSLRRAVCDGMFDAMDSYDSEAEYDANEYAGYSGKGICLASFDIGEYEEQIEVKGYDVLCELHDQGRLDDVLDDVNCDVYVSRSQRRVKNETTGYYENVGRKTYNPYNRPDPTFEVYTNPGGQWRFVVSEERANELLVDAIVEYCNRVDCNG